MTIHPNVIYITRGGRKARVYATDGAGRMGIHGAVFRDDGWWICTWDEAGHADASCIADPDDLTKEIATVYGQDGCPECEREILRLQAEGYHVEYRDAAAIDRERDTDARAALAMQNMELPLVRIGGKFMRRKG